MKSDELAMLVSVFLKEESINTDSDSKHFSQKQRQMSMVLAIIWQTR